MTRVHRSKLALRTAAVGLVLGVIGSGLLVACGGVDEPATVLDPADTNTGGVDESPYDPVTSLVLPGDFTDATAVREIAAVQRFFERTPYGRRSFLETYSSNGITAAGAVLAAAVKFKINPIVLLVRLQMAQGLIGLEVYPEPSTRTEFAFQCGCDGGQSCLPEMAGLDRQLECLAARLRSYLTQISVSPEPRTTYGGWGPNYEAITLDGVVVTPPDDSTAALYQLDPVYGEKTQRGAWLFHRIYVRYTRSFGYGGSIDPEFTGGWIGEPCTQNSDCSSAISGAVCLIDDTGGYCSSPCDFENGCPSAPQKPGAICADLQDRGGGCLAQCNPAAPNCREGYTCADVKLYADSSGEVRPACTKPQ